MTLVTTIDADDWVRQPVIDANGNMVGSVTPRSGTLPVLTALTTAGRGELSLILTAGGVPKGIFQHYGGGVAGGTTFYAPEDIDHLLDGDGDGTIGALAIGTTSVANKFNGIALGAHVYTRVINEVALGDGGKLGIQCAFSEGSAGDTDVGPNINLPHDDAHAAGFVNFYTVDVLVGGYGTDQTNYAKFSRELLIYSKAGTTAVIKNTNTVGVDVRAGAMASITVSFTISGTGDSSVLHVSTNHSTNATIDPAVTVVVRRISNMYDD